jgi:predicted Zn-ribbon and HTH transcriptional regulator
MAVEYLILFYMLALLLGIANLAIYSELQRRRFRPAATEDRIFRCEKCGFVYTDDPDVDRSRCAQCGMLNEAISF